MALGQLQMGGSVYPTVQQPAVGSTKPLDIAQQAGRKLGQWQEGQAEDIMLRSLMGQPAKQSFLDKLMGKEVPAAAVTQQPREMFQEGQKGDLSFNPQVFESFRNKFNMTNLQNQMLNQATDTGTRRKLMGMLHEKLPSAIQKQQRTDSMELLEKMYSSQLARLGDSDKANDALSKMIENDPRARAWFNDYFAGYENERDVPDLVNTIKNKLGESNLGTTASAIASQNALSNIKKYVRSEEGMTDKSTNVAMKSLDNVIKNAEGKGYKFVQKGGGNYQLVAPGKRDIVLSWDPYQMRWIGDYWGEHHLGEAGRYFGFDEGQDPINMGEGMNQLGEFFRF